MNEQSLSEGFPQVSRDDWLKRVDAVLKGAPFAESLTTRLPAGIVVEPLYSEEQAARIWRAKAAPWMVIQRIDHPDPAAANRQALDDLGHGATGLAFAFQGAASAHGFGLAEADQKSIARALADVRLDCIALQLDPGPNGSRVAEALAAHIATQPIDPERLTLDFGLDPIGAMAARGDLDATWPEIAERALATVKGLRVRHFTGPFMSADGRIWHDGGATEAQELGLVLATAVGYLRALEELPADILAQAVSITLAADQDMFLSLAKFRATRQLWSRVLDVAHLPSAQLKLHGETSWRMMAAKDPHTNILRSTAAVFGAGLGGANSIAVLPFSAAQGLPDEFARRVARNSQTILLDESNLWRVADPAGGAGYVESLTMQLCARAWLEFQAIEQAGGIIEALRSGLVQAGLAEARRQAAAGIAEGKQSILGVTAFTSAIESLPAIETAIAVMPRPRIGAAILVEPIPASRLTEAFEAGAAARPAQ